MRVPLFNATNLNNTTNYTNETNGIRTRFFKTLISPFFWLS